MVDHLGVIRRESARFSKALHAGDLAAAVPSCPGWTLADLGLHLIEVQHFWGEIAEQLLQDVEEYSGRPAPDADELAGTFDDVSERLLRWLTERDPADRCWSWHAEGGSIAWVRRRQAHEALIHRIDAELAIGEITPVDLDAAVDGVDEIFDSQIDGPVPEWGTLEREGVFVRVAAADAERTWDLEFCRFQGTSPVTDTTYDIPSATRVDQIDTPGAVIRGTAADLDLWLWGRTGLDALEVTGDESLATKLREVAAEATG